LVISQPILRSKKTGLQDKLASVSLTHKLQQKVGHLSKGNIILFHYDYLEMLQTTDKT